MSKAAKPAHIASLLGSDKVTADRPGDGDITAVQLDELAGGLKRLGLACRGAFHPVPEDRVPALADGSPALTIILLGWTGGV
jgi:hypothetical protein